MKKFIISLLKYIKHKQENIVNCTYVLKNICIALIVILYLYWIYICIYQIYIVFF